MENIFLCTVLMFFYIKGGFLMNIIDYYFNGIKSNKDRSDIL